jgi:hypothetical protein
MYVLVFIQNASDVQSESVYTQAGRLVAYSFLALLRPQPALSTMEQ